MYRALFFLTSLSVSVVASPTPQSPTTNTTSTESTNTTSPALNLTSVSSNTATSLTSSASLNTLLAGIANLPIIGEDITAISNVLTTAEAALAVTTGTDTTQNGLSSGEKCAAMTVIFARGTTEPGNVGLLTGPPFFDALTAMVGQGSVAVQGVDYPASIDGFLEGGDKAGSQKMATLVNTAMSNCPSTQVVMSGYSQGGQLVHNAAALLPAATMAKVSSVVIFGDPDDGQAVAGAAASKTKVICHAGDNICDHGDLILLPHLTYSMDAQKAATFAVAQAGLGIGDYTGN